MKTVLITGASRGIGRATALLFASKGYHTIITCSKSFEELEAVKKEIEDTYHTPCTAVVCDVSKYEEVAKLFETIQSLDVLVNNAGIAFFGLLQDMSSEEWKHVIDTNLSSVFYTCKQAIPLMLKQGSGSIVNVSSIWGDCGASMEVAYSTSKGGINALTKALSKELAPNRIPVNAIAFGVIDTAMNNCLSDEDKEVLRAEIPADRFGTVEEAAKLIWQTANAPTYMTGQVITMAGGF